MHTNGPLKVATIAVWHETPTKAGGFTLPAASYGIALDHGQGQVQELWGTTYAPEPIAPTVLAIWELLQLVPKGTPLRIHAIAEMQRYVENPNGIIRAAMRNGGRGKVQQKLKPYREMKQIVIAMDADRWELLPYRDPRTAPHYYAVAGGLAKGIARRAAEAHTAEHNPTPLDYPQPSIVVRGA